MSRQGAALPLTQARAGHGYSPWGSWHGPRKGPSTTHASKGDTWTLYKNHRRFCTRTWGRGDESLPSPARGQHRCPAPRPGDTIHIFNVLKTNQAQTHSTCHRVAARVALGPAAGRHSESGHEWAVAAPSCPLHRGCQGPTKPVQPGPRQQPEPHPSPRAGLLAGGKVPCVLWKAHGAPRTQSRRRGSQGDARRAPRGAEPRGDAASPYPAGWAGATAGHSLQACTHRQREPRPQRRGPSRLSRAEAVVGEVSALVPITPPSPGSQSPGAPGVFGRQETPPRSCPGCGGASSPTRRRRAGGPGAREQGC